MQRKSLNLNLSSIVLIIFTSAYRMALADGGIVTDGSVGPVQALNGAQVTIPQELGSTSGQNLFHSFAQFNIQNGQTVTFTETTPNTLNNVVSRVTGGSASEINGLLSSTPGGHANFFLLNPAGVMFGNGAQIDVPGAFHVSTANSLKFSDGELFNASLTNDGSLSSAEPASFGFLASTAANNGLLQIQGATLTFTEGQTVDLVGGGIETLHSSVHTPGGEIRLVAVDGTTDSVGLTALDGALPLPAEIPSASNAGAISIRDSQIKTNGNSGGRIGVWGGEVLISTQDPARLHGLDAFNTGERSATPAQGIIVKSNNLLLDGTRLRTESNQSGSAGSINVQTTQDTRFIHSGRIYSVAMDDSRGSTGNITISSGNDVVQDGVDSPDGFLSSISAVVLDRTAGNAGDVNISAGRDLQVVNHAQIASLVGYDSIGSSGSVNLSAGRDVLVTNDKLTDGASAIFSESLGNSPGNSGNVMVKAGRNMLIDGLVFIDPNANQTATQNKLSLTASGKLTLGKSGVISSYTVSTQNAPDIDISAQGEILVQGQIESRNTINDAQVATGNSGKINIHSGNNLTVDGGQIKSSDYLGTGSAGDISLSSDGKFSLINTGGIISANLNSPNNAGNITVFSRGDILLQGIDTNDGISIISSSTHTQGNAGKVTVTSGGSLSMNNRASISSSTSGTGSAGDIYITTQGDVNLLNKGVIFNSSLNFGSIANGNAGNITINSASNILVGKDSSIDSGTAASSLSNGGTVRLTAAGELNIKGGLISVGTLGFGAAGNIEMQASKLNADHGIITSGSKGETSSGKNGNIFINANQEISLTNSSLISSFNEAVVTASELLSITPGNINFSASNIHLNNSSIFTDAGGNTSAGNINLNFSHGLTQKGSIITTLANSGNGGAINLNGGRFITQQNSILTTSVDSGQGNGGNILASADVFVMDSSLIQANAASGNGGNIDLNLIAIIPGSSTIIQGGERVGGASFIPNYNIIQAVSENGVNGITNINAPQLNLSGVLANIGNPQFDGSVISQDYCDLGTGSTLTRQGKGGMMPKASDLQF